MLFNSYQFILIFLPIVLTVYFLLNKFRLITLSAIWLVIASLYFYASWNIKFLWILIFSIIFNFAAGQILSGKIEWRVNKKVVLALGIIINILCLGYFKYTNFLIENINEFLNLHFNYMHIIMPLAISFFTFQQIAYLVDVYKQKVKQPDFLTYMLFITFFPRLMQGPITRGEEMLPQFLSLRTKIINWKNLSLGLFLFSVGLFKKVVFADMLSKWAVMGLGQIDNLTFLESWITVLSYTFQIYFDFSGYTDMALGIGLMFNINIPRNFNNPYIATDIQDFWRRWHITLSRCLKDYLYIPLGGNRKGNIRTYFNIFCVFFVCGLWHGANRTYIIWGIMHGAASIINRLYKLLNIEMPKFAAWLITFVFINFGWIYFSAPNIASANKLLISCLNIMNIDLPRIYGLEMRFRESGHSWEIYPLIVIPVMIFFIFNNFFRDKLTNFQPKTIYSVYIVLMLLASFYNIVKPDYSSTFIYFQF